MQQTKKNFEPVSLSDFMAKEFKDSGWIVEQLIPAEGITAVSAAPASHKTWMILDLALKVATGGIIFDKFFTNKTGVLIVNEEDNERLLQQRIKKLQKNFELPIYLVSLQGFKLSEGSVANLITFAQEHDTKVIVFDSLVRIHVADENDAIKMAGVFDLLKKFCKEGLTVIFTHHNRKQGLVHSSPSQSMRGSSDILASVDCHLAVERKDNLLTITQTKLRQGVEIKPFKLNIISDDNEVKYEFAGEVEAVQTKKSDFKEAIRDILEEEGKPMFKKELSESLKNSGIEGGYSTFKAAIKEMVDKGELYESKGEKNKTFCSLKPFGEQSSLVG